jgi:hypothetical protein
MRLLMASTSVIRLAARPPLSSCLRPAFRSVRRAPLPLAAAQSGCAKLAFSTTSVKKNQPGHEEETFEEFTARYMSFVWLLVDRKAHVDWAEGPWRHDGNELSGSKGQHE